MICTCKGQAWHSKAETRFSKTFPIQQNFCKSENCKVELQQTFSENLILYLALARGKLGIARLKHDFQKHFSFSRGFAKVKIAKLHCSNFSENLILYLGLARGKLGNARLKLNTRALTLEKYLE